MYELLTVLYKFATIDLLIVTFYFTHLSWKWDLSWVTPEEGRCIQMVTPGRNSWAVRGAESGAFQVSPFFFLLDVL